MNIYLQRAGLLFMVIGLSSCASLSEKFTSKEKINLDPFATTTINMVNSIDYGLDRNSTILTKPYLNSEGKPGLQRLLKLDSALYRVLQDITAYSIKLVSLSSSSKTPKQKVQAFADYIEQLDKPALAYHLAQGNIKKQDYLDVLEDIRKQEDLLAALKAAQPLIDYMMQYVDSITERIRYDEIAAENEIEKAIDSDYAVEIKYVKMLRKRRDMILNALILVNKQYGGSSSALVLLNQDKMLKKIGVKTQHATSSNIKRLENELIQKLENVHHQLDLMDKENASYMKVHQELDSLVKFHDQEIGKAKGIIQLWASAHSKMANGVTDPADWFDVSDPGSELFGLVKSAISR